MKKVLLVVAVMFFSALCMADTVFLNDGQVFRGEIISENDSAIVIQTYNGNDETIQKNFIRRIVRDNNYRGYRRMMRRGYESDHRWYGDEWIFKFGFDFDGTHETSNSNLFISGSGNTSLNGTQDVNSGLSFGGEYVSFESENVGLGGGFTVQFLRGLTDVPGNFSFLPIYGLVKVRTSPSRENTYAYLIGQLGYNFFNGDLDYKGTNGRLDGGLYFGVGAGVNVNRVQFELLYTEDRGRARDSGSIFNSQTGLFDYFNESGNIKYSKLGLNIGWVF